MNTGKPPSGGFLFGVHRIIEIELQLLFPKVLEAFDEQEGEPSLGIMQSAAADSRVALANALVHANGKRKCHGKPENSGNSSEPRDAVFVNNEKHRRD